MEMPLGKFYLWSQSHAQIRDPEEIVAFPKYSESFWGNQEVQTMDNKDFLPDTISYGLSLYALKALDTPSAEEQDVYITLL